jgi:uncharacterized membrane protein YfcA
MGHFKRVLTSVKGLSKRFWALFVGLPAGLDWVLSVVEPLIVLGIGVFIIYSAYWLIWGPEHSSQQARIAQAMKMMHDNWKAGLILIVPLFYRTIRGFLERVEEFAGAKAPRRPKSTLPEKANPIPESQPSPEEES